MKCRLERWDGESLAEKQSFQPFKGSKKVEPKAFRFSRQKIKLSKEELELGKSSLNRGISYDNQIKEELRIHQAR